MTCPGKFAVPRRWAASGGADNAFRLRVEREEVRIFRPVRARVHRKGAGASGSAWRGRASMATTLFAVRVDGRRCCRRSGPGLASRWRECRNRSSIGDCEDVAESSAAECVGMRCSSARTVWRRSGSRVRPTGRVRAERRARAARPCWCDASYSERCRRVGVASRKRSRRVTTAARAIAPAMSSSRRRGGGSPSRHHAGRCAAGDSSAQLGELGGVVERRSRRPPR